MSEPSFPRPVRPGPRPAVPGPAPTVDEQRAGREGGTSDDHRFAALSERPVAEHVEVFEAEHARLRSELGTIDRL